MCSLRLEKKQDFAQLIVLCFPAATWAVWLPCFVLAISTWVSCLKWRLERQLIVEDLLPNPIFRSSCCKHYFLTAELVTWVMSQWSQLSCSYKEALVFSVFQLSLWSLIPDVNLKGLSALFQATIWDPWLSFLVTNLKKQFNYSNNVSKHMRAMMAFLTAPWVLEMWLIRVWVFKSGWH